MEDLAMLLAATSERNSFVQVFYKVINNTLECPNYCN
jgi:hypothetical protein